MDPTQIIFNGLMSVAAFVVAWQFKTIHETVKELQVLTAKLEVEQGRHDERGKSLKEQLDAIFEILREINQKLDTKADK